MADDGGRVPMSPGLQATLLRAREYAAGQSHAQVSLEHLLLALSEDQDAAGVLDACQVDLGRLRHDVAGYLGSLGERVPPGTPGAPAISTALTQVLKYATLAAQQGRRMSIDGAIVLAALVGDGRSMAASFLKAQGLTFEAAVRALREAAVRAQPPPPAPLPPPPREAPGPAPVAPMAALSSLPHTSTGSRAEDILARARERIAARAEAAPPPPAEAEPLPPSAASLAEPLGERAEPAAAAPPMPQAEPAPPVAPSGPPPAPAAAPALAPTLASTAEAAPPAPPRFEPPPPVAEATLAPPRQEATPPEPPRAPIPGPPPVSLRPAQPPPAPGWAPPLRPAVTPPAPSMPPQPSSAPPPAAGWSPRPLAPATRSAPPDVPVTRPPWTEPRFPAGAQPAPPGPVPPPATPPDHGLHPEREPAPESGALVPARRPAVDATQLALSIPRRMTEGRAHIVEVRIERPALTLPGAGPRSHALRPETAVARAIAVRLKAIGGRFVVDPGSPETQWDQSGAAGTGRLASEAAVWRFTITPLEAGRGTLQLAVSARTLGADGVLAETQLPDQAHEVRIAPDWGRRLVRAAIVAGAALGAVVLVKAIEGLARTDLLVLAKRAVGL